MKKWMGRFWVLAAVVLTGWVFSPRADAGESFSFSVGYSSGRYRCAPPPVWYHCPPRPCYPRSYISYSYSYVYSPPVVVYSPPPPPVVYVPPPPVYYYQGGVFYRY